MTTAQHLFFNLALFVAFCAGCWYMVRRQYRQTEATRREAERLTAELEELAAEIFDRMPDDEPQN